MRIFSFYSEFLDYFYVHDHLKNICQIEHSRHRSPLNFLVNLIAGLAAYTYLPKKPSIDIYPKDLPALLPAIF